jgi:hypothetical protein
MAARTALRAVPLLADNLGEYGFGRYGVGVAEIEHAVISPTFRALAVAWFVCCYPDHREKVLPNAKLLFSATVAASAYDPFSRTNLARRPGDIDWIASAITAATAIAALDVHGDPLGQAANTVRNAVTHDPTVSSRARDGSIFWIAVLDDARFIEGGGSVVDLVKTPLWPSKCPVEILKRWQDLKCKLVASNDDWSVWVEWYEARWSGEPANEPVEIARATIAEELWVGGPRAVNRYLLELAAKS